MNVILLNKYRLSWKLILVQMEGLACLKAGLSTNFFRKFLCQVRSIKVVFQCSAGLSSDRLSATLYEYSVQHFQLLLKKAGFGATSSLRGNFVLSKTQIVFIPYHQNFPHWLHIHWRYVPAVSAMCWRCMVMMLLSTLSVLHLWYLQTCY